MFYTSIHKLVQTKLRYVQLYLGELLYEPKYVWNILFFFSKAFIVKTIPTMFKLLTNIKSLIIN